jgi:hypothetical protein
MQVPPVLEQEFLPLRAKLLEIAAALDRVDRSEVTDSHEPRLLKIHTALDVLLHAGGDRAEQVQLIFSRAYADDWREKFSMSND